MIAKKKEVRRLALSKETLRRLLITELKRAAGGLPKYPVPATLVACIREPLP